MQTDLADIDALVAQGEGSAALGLLEERAAAGDMPALLRLAEWTMFGTVAERDVVRGRKLYEKAARAGDRMANEFVTNLLASGIGGERNWRKAIKRLRREAETSSMRRVTLAALKGMELDTDGRSRTQPASQLAYRQPAIRIFEQFLAPVEMAYLIEISERFMAPSIVFDIATGRNVPDPARTSSQATFIPLFEDPVIHALNRRIAAASAVPVTHGEPLQVLRYTRGQEFRRHLDADPRHRNIRARTFLIWLSDGYTGGETVFPRLGIELRGRPGDAALFDNLDAAGRPEPLSEHAGRPVQSGVKYLVSRWLCAGPYDLRA